MSDVYFDGVAEAFNAAIYETSRGYIRLGVLWADLRGAVPEIQTDKLRILDVGGGMGQVATRLARLGHSVVLADPSEEMLGRARSVVSREGLSNITLIRSSAQELKEHTADTFDLVMCHAVLEWVASPGAVIGALRPFVKPSGALSLMFHNQNAAVFKSVTRGDFATYASPHAAREVEASVPTKDETGQFKGARALRVETVTRLLQDHGLEVTHRAGVRIFHDHILDLTEERLEGLLELEKNYRSVEPFASLAQHIHLVCRRDAS